MKGSGSFKGLALDEDVDFVTEITLWFQNNGNFLVNIEAFKIQISENRLDVPFLCYNSTQNLLLSNFEYLKNY